MALDNIKEKLKKPFHRSKNRDSSGSESTSHTRTRSNTTNDRPGSSRLSHDHRAQCMIAHQPQYGVSLMAAATAISSQSTAAIAPASNYISSRQSSVSSLNESSPDRTAAPGLHNTDYKLPQVPRQSDFSSDFTELTFSSQQAGHNSTLR